VSLTIFGSAGGKALQGNSKLLAIVHLGAQWAILTKVKNTQVKYRLDTGTALNVLQVLLNPEQHYTWGSCQFSAWI